jgi:RNA polymerase sigma-70 factor (ECF subfamily)
MATALLERDDSELLALVQAGDHHAFAVLVRRHTLRFYRLAFRFMQERAAAEDIVQDAFLKIWEQPWRWQPRHNIRFTTWFYRIVVNLCLDARKKKKALPLDDEFAASVADGGSGHSEILSQQQLQDILEAEIATLPARQRTALNMCFGAELSNQEAADAMGLQLKALQSLLMRAKATLKKRMRKYL